MAKVTPNDISLFFKVRKLFLKICIQLCSQAVELLLFNLCSISSQQLGFVALHVNKFTTLQYKQSYISKWESFNVIQLE